MQLSNTETNVLLVALDHMEEEILDLMKRTLTIQAVIPVEERLEACRTTRNKIKEL